MLKVNCASDSLIRFYVTVNQKKKKIKIKHLLYYNWPFAKTRPPSLLLLCSTSHAALTPYIMLSRSEKYRAKRTLTTHRQTRQSRLLLIWNIFIFKEIQTIKPFCGSLMCRDPFLQSMVVTDCCSVSVQAACELTISFSLLVISWNKHEWTSEGILFQPRKDVNTQIFSQV